MISTSNLAIARAILETYIGGSWTDDDIRHELERDERGDTLLTFMLRECCEEDIGPVEAQDRLFAAFQAVEKVYTALTPLIGD